MAGRMCQEAMAMVLSITTISSRCFPYSARRPG
jgi:hypothetical protein